MTGTPPTGSEQTPIEATLAFLKDHLGHRISTFNRHRGTRRFYTLADIDPRTDRAYEPYERPWWRTGPDTYEHGPAHSIRYVFAEADELACTECRTSRSLSDANAILTALHALAQPYLTGAAATLRSEAHLRNAHAMARLIAALTTTHARAADTPLSAPRRESTLS